MDDQVFLSQRAFTVAHDVEQKENQLLEMSAVNPMLLSEEDSQKCDQLRKQIEELKVEFSQVIHQCLPK